jgi:predicted nuclease of predicted toxin-antitoxin system
VTLAPEVWVDAQLPPALAGWLHEEHQVGARKVQGLDLRSASDRQIFSAASQAGAVVMTKDSDFVGPV